MKNKGIVLILYPNKKHIPCFKQEVGNQRFLWNHFMDLQIKEYKKSGKFLFYNEMAAMLPKLKEEFPFLKLGNSQSLQQTLKDLEKAFKAFFKGDSGFPKFKKYGSNDSYRIPQHFKRKKGKIKLPKIGIVRCRGSFHQRKIKLKVLQFLVTVGSGLPPYV